MISAKQYNIMNSPRWINFLESTALSLQLNLILIDKDEPGIKVQVPQICPVCKKPFENFYHDDFTLDPLLFGNYCETRPILTRQGQKVELLSLEDGFYIIARDCSCIVKRRLPSLQERALLAQKLLGSFLTALCEGIAGGKSNLELSALRQINQIMLSLFQGEPDIAKRTFDLILSALIILLDAEASWLEYHDGSQEQCIIKGNRELAEINLKSSRILKKFEYSIVDVRGNGPNIIGRLGICKPFDSAKSASILPLMAQECTFVFEIEHLFFLLKTQLSRVLGALTSMVILVDEHSQILYLNQSAESFLGESAVHFIGQSVTILPAFWSRYVQNQVNFPVSDSKVVLNHGEKITLIDWQIIPLIDEEMVAGWLILADDRTDYYHWQEIGRKAESNSTIASVIGPLAHELRNPLAATKGLLQLMQRRREPEKIVGYIDLILREIDRMNSLVNKFLQLGRTAKTHFEVIDLAEILRELLPLLMGEASDAGVEIIYQFDSASPVLADQGQIIQVILNLFRNAVEAAGRDGQVKIGVKSDRDWVVLDFENTGSKIPPEIMERLFQPFVTNKEHGTGLGLAVAKAIVTNHGGTISAANLIDDGVLFSVKLPVESQKVACARDVDAIIALSDEMICYPLEQVLQAAGYSTWAAKSFHALLEKKALYQPFIIIADANNQLQDIDVMQKNWPGVQFLLIGEPSGVNELLNIKFLPKPVNYARLIELVRSMMKPTEEIL
jgi:signal transduction histidine kinase